MAFYNFGNLSETLDNLGGVGGVVKNNADKGTQVKVESTRIEQGLEMVNYSGSNKLLNALVDSGPGYITLTPDLEKRSAGITRQDVDDLTIKSIKRIL